MSYCTDDRMSECHGEIHERLSLSGSGMTFPRCDKHYELYVERLRPTMEEIRLRYPAQAPDDFDPTYAGETWEEEQ